jgi:hypothetical protein
MTRQNGLFCLVLLFSALSLPVLAADDKPKISPSVTQGGMTCFTITPANDRKHWSENPSCDELCGNQNAACSGVTNGAMNPPTKCDDPPPPNFAVCRCCKVGDKK